MMPKAMSLKKSSNDKMQKPITQFFKCDTVAVTGSQSQTTEIKSEEKEVKHNPKRKAYSPVKCTSNVFVGESLATSEFDDASSSTYSKKQKNNNDTLESSRQQYCTFPKSPLVFHSDENVRIKYEKDESRLPLSPVNKDNASNDKTDIVHKNLSKNILEKENGTDNIVIPINTTTNYSPYKKTLCLSLKRNMTPIKSPKATISTSPRVSPLKSPGKHREHNLQFSPSKCGSTVKVLTFSQNDIEDIFDDDWDISNDKEHLQNLDLSFMQRCEIISVIQHPTRLELILKNDKNNKGTCFLEGVWASTPLQVSDIITILATRDSAGQFVVTNSSGLLALRPDYLMSSTSVVAGVFCKRKAILQERWRGIDSANTAMTVGILVHDLVQAALTRHVMSAASLQSEADNIIRQSTPMLYDAGLTIEETRRNMQAYITPLAEFMHHYVKSNTGATGRQKNQWNGSIDEVLDIEENVCCPTLGLKGKIDATLQVTIHERTGSKRAVVPLELKSGKASMSAEHRGQLVLYCMMLGLQRGEHPATTVQRGLLLYLKDKIELREVSCGYPERRDLMMLRNELVQHLAEAPGAVDTEQIVDIEEASSVLHQNLPEPVHHENACAKCPYLTICSLHLWHTDGPKVSEKHPLTKLRDAAMGHLAPEHVKYFFHWTSLLRLEEKEQMTSSPLHSLWTDSPEERLKRGTCSANLILKTVTASGDRYEHVFAKDRNIQNGFTNNRKGPQDGEFSVVSIDNRPWIAAGVITQSNEKEICIMLERDLSRRLNKDTVYHIDTYESYATTVYNLTNLGVLMEDSDRALRLRKLLIDKKQPNFSPKLHRSVGRLGAKLMRSLNIEQQRAVLRALAAEDYALLRGLPGTGKTQTIGVLIQMLVGLQQRVLVTAHTHSAVDTVLSRLPDSLQVMRLGSSQRVAAALRQRCEDTLTATCTTPEQLGQLYDSMDVVGVTCLGAAHAMLSRTTFDVCIVDEATQVLQSTVLRPLFAAKRFVLVGDPDQLPPVVRSRTARRLGMEDSLFHRLMSEEAVSTLHLQYRMNQPLVDIANRVAYNDRLKCANQNVAQATLNIDVEKIKPDTVSEEWLLTASSSQSSRAAVFLDMPPLVSGNNDTKNLANIDEVCVVLALVEILKQGGVQSSDIGVIAPYRDQVSLLRRALQHWQVEASTVDQFQGRDKSVIVYSCSKRDDSKHDRKVKEGEVLNDKRRLAVSVTRAKHKLILIGNKRALQRYDTLQPLIEACHSIPLEQGAIQRLFSKYRAFVT